MAQNWLLFSSEKRGWLWSVLFSKVAVLGWAEEVVGVCVRLPHLVDVYRRKSEPHLYELMFGSITMFGWNAREKVKFESVPSEDSETLLLASERSSVDAHRVAAAHNGISWLAAGMLVAITAILSALLGAWVTQRSRLDADAFSIRYTSQYCTSMQDCSMSTDSLIECSSDNRGSSDPVQSGAIQWLIDEVQCLQAGFRRRGRCSVEVAWCGLHVIR
jgi:hypothetical protein